MATSKTAKPALQTRVQLGKIGYSTIYTLAEDNSHAFFYEAGMTIDADGAPKAYNANSALGLDRLGNAGHPGDWWALVTDANGNPLVQGPNDPAPGFYISTTALEDTSKPRSNPRRYVDASTVPFIVLPGKKSFGAQLADCCIVYNTANRKISGGIYADIGPRDKIGEASIAMAAALGINSNPRTGGVGNGLVYLVFPGSGKNWPLTNEVIEQKAQAAFSKWGGLARLKTVMPDVIA